MSYSYIELKADYLGKEHIVIQRNDGAIIPVDLANNDYLAYLRWLDEQ